MEDRRVVEVGGVKLEIDMRHAKVIENYKIGDDVRVLIKKYGDAYESHPGVIVAFHEFKNLPSIVILYLDSSYSECKLETVIINSKTEAVEICPASPHEIPFDFERVVDLLDRIILKQERELEDAIAKKSYFINHFKNNFQYFIDKQAVEAPEK